jgi:hypothetical protein
MKLWDHSEDLWEREIKERLRLGEVYDDKDSLPDWLWLEKWTAELMSTIQNIDNNSKIEKRCRSKYLE